MKKFYPVLVACVGLLIGAACGWFAAKQRLGNWARSFTAAGVLGDLGNDFDALRALRAGNTNEAIATLENHMDSQIMALGALAAEQREEKKRASYIRALRRVSDYRVAHPWKSSSPEVQEVVGDALSIPDKGGSK